MSDQVSNQVNAETVQTEAVQQGGQAEQPASAPAPASGPGPEVTVEAQAPPKKRRRKKVDIQVERVEEQKSEPSEQSFESFEQSAKFIVSAEEILLAGISPLTGTEARVLQDAWRTYLESTNKTISPESGLIVVHLSLLIPRIPVLVKTLKKDG